MSYRLRKLNWRLNNIPQLTRMDGDFVGQNVGSQWHLRIPIHSNIDDNSAFAMQLEPFPDLWGSTSSIAASFAPAGTFPASYSYVLDLLVRVQYGAQGAIENGYKVRASISAIDGSIELKLIKIVLGVEQELADESVAPAFQVGINPLTGTRVILRATDVANSTADVVLDVSIDRGPGQEQRILHKDENSALYDQTGTWQLSTGYGATSTPIGDEELLLSDIVCSNDVPLDAFDPLDFPLVENFETPGWQL